MGSAYSYGVALGDVDGDGDLDAFVANTGGQANQVWLNQGGAQAGTPGAFRDSGQDLGEAKSVAVALGDLDGDGDLDAFVGNDGQGNQVWLNQGGAQGGTAGVYRDSGQSLGSSYSYGLALGDLDGDGDLDAFVANAGSQANLVWLNEGGAQGGTPGRFRDSGQRLGSSRSIDVALGDVDGDGDLDALVANRLSDQDNRLWLNSGGLQGGKPGVFASSRSVGRYQTGAVALGDLDGDGDLDAYLGNLYGEADRVWLNQGGLQGASPGVFADSGQGLRAPAAALALSAAGAAPLAEPSTRDVALGDLDGDGDLDAFAGVSSAANKVWLNRDAARPCYSLALAHTGLGDDPSAAPPSSEGCPSGQYAAGEAIALTPHPAAGYHLDHWSGTDGAASDRLAMPAGDHTVTAHYAPDEAPVVQVGSGAVAPGGSIAIAVEALHLSGAGLGAATIEVRYDAAVAAVVGCAVDPGGAFDEATCHDDGRAVRISVAAAGGLPGDSVLANITFRAVGWDGDSTALEAAVQTFVDPDGHPIAVSERHGQITVRAADGDVNCDDRVNVVDALFILQREVGLRPQDGDVCPPAADGLYLPGCDTNGDGDCNAVDALLIMQCEVGMANALCPGAAGLAGQAPRAAEGPGAAAEVWLGIGSGSVPAGDSLTLPLTASLGEQALGAATVTIAYDPAKLEATACSADPGSRFDLAVCNVAMAAGKVGLTVISAAGAVGDPVLAEITFRAVGHAGETSELRLAAEPFTGPDGQALGGTIQDGQVIIVSGQLYYHYLPLALRLHQATPQ